MNTYRSLIYIVFFSVLAFSCGNDFYIPQQSNLLILEEKEELKTSIAFNHLQAAYSPKNKLGLKGQFTFINIDGADANRNLLMGELGVGLYTNKIVSALNVKENKPGTYPKTPLVGVELYANLSVGRLTSQTLPNNRSTFGGSAQGIRFFQANHFYPNLSSQIYWQSKSFTLNFGTRFGLFYYYNGFGSGDYTDQELLLTQDLVESTPFALAVYDLQISNGNDRIQTFAQVTWNQSFSRFLDPSSAFSFGLKINLPNLIESLQGIKQEKSEKSKKSKKSKKRK